MGKFLTNSRQKVWITIAILGMMGLVGSGSASATNLSEYTTINPDYQQYLQDAASGKQSNWGLIPNKYTSRPIVGGKGSDITLPATYSVKDNGGDIVIKNQGGDGICWAYATTSAIESKTRKSLGKTIEFSPKQLDYLMTDTRYGAYLRNAIGVTHQLGEGANFLVASIGLSSQYAPATESSFFAKMKANDTNLESFDTFNQYNDNALLLSPFVEMKAYTKPMAESNVLGKAEYVVTDFASYDGQASDVIEKTKLNLYQNGAMYVGSTAPETENCWDASTKTIIDKGMSVCGADNAHAMTIIGWDDNHAYSDPATGATKTGAFLIQNSWGKSSLYDDNNVTVDGLMNWAEDAGAFVDKTPEQIAAIRQSIAQYIETYSADEYIYLGYDFSDSIDFGVIKGVSKNDWLELHDAVNAKQSSFDNGEVIYEWVLDEDRGIDSVSLGALASFDIDVDYAISISSGTARATKTVHIPAGEANRVYTKLDKPLYASGNVKVSIKSATERAELDASIKDYLMPTIYTVEAPDEDDIVVPDTSVPTSPDYTTPNTGLFTGNNETLIACSIIATIVIGTGLYITFMVYKNKKHIFHRIGFHHKD